MIDLTQINEISKGGLILCNDFLSLTCAWEVGDVNYIISQLALMDVLEELE